MRTGYRSSTLQPQFFVVMNIPTIYPTMVTKLYMNFKDNDKMAKDDYIGSTSFRLDEIFSGKYKHPRWVYFYGAHFNAVDDALKLKMNQVPELASRFKGALKLAMKIEETEDPSFNLLEMHKEEIQKVQKLKKHKFIARFYIELVQNFKGSSDETYKVCIDWGNKQIHSEAAKFKRGVLLFFERVVIEQTFEI